MPCSVTEIIRTASLNQVEVGEIDPESPSYPFPKLSLTGRKAEMTVPILVLENDLVRAEIAPSLGGRVLKFERKASPFQPSNYLELQEGGSRGVFSPFGIQLSLNGSEPLDAMGSVDATTRVAEDGEAAEVLIAGVCWPFSFHLRYELLHDQAEIGVEVKAFNRSLQPAFYNAMLAGGDDVPAIDSPLPFQGMTSLSRDLYQNSSRFGYQRAMAPHQLDSWQATLTPLDPDQDPQLLGSGVSVKMMPDGLRFMASRAAEGLKVVLLDAEGQMLEATITVGVSEPLDISLGADHLPLRGLVIMDGERNELLSWPPETIDGAEFPEETLPSVPAPNDSPDELKNAAFRMEHRYLCHLLLGYQALARSDWAEADGQFEQSLLFNGEDHLAWAFKAYALRMLDPDADNSNETLNAHYLAPLDPLLRVCAFLGQPIQEGKDANPILAPLADQPDQIVDVACLLLEAGLFQDAARFLAEVARTTDFPMLRYLLAFCYLSGSRMEMEAAEQLRRASAISFVAPFPFRPMEIQALDALRNRWPNDALVGRYWELAERNQRWQLRRS